MCGDHTYNGTPVRKVPRRKILELLTEGVQPNDRTEDTPENRQTIMLRLEIELIIRRLLGETH